MNRYKWIIIVIILQIIAALYLGMQLSDDVKIPSHWNIKGEIDGYMGKWTGILLFPGINIFLLLLMYFLPAYSARYKDREEQFDKIIPRVTFIIVFFFAVIHLYTILLANGVFEPDGKYILALIGLMFILLGNLLPKIPSNFIAGIRTPWTLSSETVWRKTHRVGGVCFILAGAIMIVIPMIFKGSQSAFIITFILLMVTILYSVVYSFISFKGVQKK